ncbi:group III truncated hemoglobin [Achromobacter sp. AONIH1]|uniref:group III truncated hemoglobin n=1 Tax=Achromobacter sp. AONIH1 TaxID=1758194 RepID=UPI000CD15D55|nr:group III truncated hemoglobin [Achromobacter sp. AONIH1]AUT50246.1 preprotein translocase subunit TatC [Achromobacter sp. AONIH1]
MDTPPLCTEDDIRDLVETFYGKVRSDALLGPVFNGMVHDWDEHLTRLSDFWSAVLLGTRRFAGMPMPTHVAMPNLSAALFERWLALFGQTTAALPNRPMADAAMQMAQRMARSLWYGYQLSRDPSLPLAELRPATPPH